MVEVNTLMTEVPENNAVDLDQLLMNLSEMIPPSDLNQSAESKLPPISIQPQQQLGINLPEQQVIKQDLGDDKEESDPYEDFVLGKVFSVSDEILKNCREDRAKASEAIKLIEDLIHNNHKIVQGGSLSRLVQAIQTRSNVDMIQVKLLETLGKILTARKGSTKIINNNTNRGTSNNLINILQDGMKNAGL